MTWIHNGIGCPRCFAALRLAEIEQDRARDDALASSYYPFYFGRAIGALESLSKGEWRLCPKHRVRRKVRA